jgi:hypothetical protein
MDLSDRLDAVKPVQDCDKVIALSIPGSKPIKPAGLPSLIGNGGRSDELEDDPLREFRPSPKALQRISISAGYELVLEIPQ